MGRRSGGMTGSTSSTIQVGSLPLRRKESSMSRRLIALSFFCPVDLSTISLTFLYSSSTFMSESSFLTASAPIPTLNAFSPYSLRASASSASVRICLYSSGVSPGSVTTKLTKYTTWSSCLGVISSISPIRPGTPLKYHMCVTGAASSMCPILSRRTLDLVTSTPHLSQIIPL